MVPIKEMTDVVRVVKERIGLRPRQWVRLKRGIYKDDLAQVDYVDMGQNQVHLKVGNTFRFIFNKCYIINAIVPKGVGFFEYTPQENMRPCDSCIMFVLKSKLWTYA